MSNLEGTLVLVTVLALPFASATEAVDHNKDTAERPLNNPARD